MSSTERFFMSKEERAGWIKERFLLSAERIGQITDHFLGSGESLSNGLCRWQADMGRRLVRATECIQQNAADDGYFQQPVLKIAEDNAFFYRPFQDEGFASSFANPEYCKNCLPSAYAELLSFMYREFSGIYLYAVMGDWERLTRYMEWYLEVYSFLEDPDREKNSAEDETLLRSILMEFLRDYAEEEVNIRADERGDASGVGAYEAIMRYAGLERLSDMSDVEFADSKAFTEETFWYRFGLPLSEEKRQRVLKLCFEKEHEDRYEEALQWLSGETAGTCVGFRGPLYKLPFFLQSQRGRNNHTGFKLCWYPVPFAITALMLEDSGLYGTMAEDYLRIRRKDCIQFIDGRTRTRILQAVAAWEQENRKPWAKEDALVVVRL